MEFKVIDPENFSLHCRTCLNKLTGNKHNLVDLSSSIFKLFQQSLDPDQNTADQLGPYPEGICEECFGKLNAFDEFQTLAKKSDEFFKQILRTFNNKQNVDTKIISRIDEFGLISLLNSDNTNCKDDPLQTKNVVKNETDDSNEFFECLAESVDNETNITSINVTNESETFSASLRDKICKICGKQLRSVWGLRIHLNTHKDTRPFPCDQCEKGFNSKLCLQQHVKLFHATTSESAEERTCKVCGKILSSVFSLNSHMHTHQDKRPYQCDQCERGFNLKARLQLHIKEAHSEKPVEITCKYGCGKIFDRLHKAQVHYRKSHSKTNGTDNDSNETKIISKDQSTQDYTCKICGKSLCSTWSLNLHMYTHSDKRPFQCNQCERGFNAKDRLRAHVRKAHTDKPLKIACTHGCEKIFDCPKKAKLHNCHQNPETNENIPKEKPKNIYVCEDCGKTFKNREYFKTHRAFHLPIEQRPFVCEKCNKRFASSACLKLHTLRHDGIKKYQCPNCGVKKTTNRELRLHISNLHTKEMQARCEICSLVLLNPISLRRHVRVVHQGIKNFKCRYCEKCFGKGETLKYHERTHTGERPHKCEHCERSFAQPTALKSHMKTHQSFLKYQQNLIGGNPVEVVNSTILKNKMVHLNEEIVSFIINKVKEVTFIWNPQDPFYFRRNTKLKFWNKLAKEINQIFKPLHSVTANETAKKWNNLKAYYQQEMNKAQKLKENGAPESEIQFFLNRWKFHKVLNFLTNPSTEPLNTDTAFETINEMDNENQIEIDNDKINKLLNENEHCSNEGKRKFTDEIIYFFIPKIKETPHVWDSLDPCYTSKLQKQLFWANLAKEVNTNFPSNLDFEANEIARKWNNLKTYYQQETKKAQQLKENGATPNEIDSLLNRWKFNKVLNFLSNTSTVSLSATSTSEIGKEPEAENQNENSNNKMHKPFDENEYNFNEVKRKFTDEEIYFLLQKVEQTPHIWDTTDPCYTSKPKKHIFWSSLSEEINNTFPSNLNFEAMELAKKWANLKAYYLYENQKISKVEESGTSKWKFYGAFYFLIASKSTLKSTILEEPNITKNKNEHSSDTDEPKSNTSNLEEEINLQNFHNFCRLCLNNAYETKYFLKDLKNSLITLLQKCTDLSKCEDSSNSCFMCGKCYEKVKQFEKLCKLTKRSTQLLEKLLKTNGHKTVEGPQSEETCENNWTCPKIEPLISNNDQLSEDPLKYVNNSDEINIKTESNDDCKDLNIENKEEFMETNTTEAINVKKLSTEIPKEQSNDFDTKISNDFSNDEHEQKPKKLLIKKCKYIQKPKPEVICEICGVVVKSKSYLKIHRYRHRPMEEWPLQCDQCSKKFIDKTNLKVHLLRHSGIRNFQCPYCGAKKVNARDLAVHVNYHTKEKQFPCNFCPRIFNRKCRWKIHERIVHQRIKNHKCGYCGIQFGTLQTLRDHELIHTGEKPHSCMICERKFRKKIALRTHMKTHNKIVGLSKKLNEIDNQTD